MTASEYADAMKRLNTNAITDEREAQALDAECYWYVMDRRRAIAAARPYNIYVLSWTVGPAHDPYSCECVTVALRDGTRSADITYNALDATTLELFEGDTLVRHLRVFDCSDRTINRARQLKLAILFRRHVGIDPRTAWEQYNETYVEDPMGSPSKYI